MEVSMGERLKPFVRPGISREILNSRGPETQPTQLTDQDKALLRAVLSPERQVVKGNNQVARVEKVIWQS